jgi:hypothetical protein
MSITAARFSSRSVLVSRYSIAEAEQDIRDFLDGCYSTSNLWELSQEEADRIFADRGKDYDEFIKSPVLKGKSVGAKYIASRINSGAEPDLAQLSKDWWSHRAIKRALTREECREIGASISDLRNIDIKTSWQARRFYSLYRAVRVQDRSWGSCYQPNHGLVLKIATTPNYNKLPNWVKECLCTHAPAHAKIGGDRIGNIWRLPACVKAWKWADFPKHIAEKVGAMSPKARMLAAFAWKTKDTYSENWDQLSRPEIEADFWARFSQIQKASFKEQIQLMLPVMGWRVRIWEAFLEQSLKLPHGVTQLKEATEASIMEVIAKYASPKVACQNLLGCSGKATVKVFQYARSDAWRWASAIAYGNADICQKILGMTTLIEWQPEVVDFLVSLPMSARIRLLQCTNFKYRGEVHPVSPDHIRDSGYLWNQLQGKPDLGRVRCWFSVHETLAAEYVKTLPDEVLPVPQGWEKVDGLCDVDGSWELEFPKRVATLKYWGEVLRNCVGGYGNAIKSGRSVIFAVREQGQLTHCVEFSNGYCNQFYQAGNSSPNYSIKESVMLALTQAGLA